MTALNITAKIILSSIELKLNTDILDAFFTNSSVGSCL